MDGIHFLRDEPTGSQNPFAAGDDPADPTDRGIETWVMGVLREAGLHDHRFVPGAYRRDYLSDPIYVWTNGTVLGVTFANEGGETGLGLTGSLLLAGYENSYDRNFSDGTRSETPFDDPELRGVAAPCVEAGGDLPMACIFRTIDELVVTVFHVADATAGDAVRKADEGVSRYFHGH